MVAILALISSILFTPAFTISYFYETGVVCKRHVGASNIGYTKPKEHSQGKGGDLRSKYNLTLTALSGLCVTYV